MCHFPTELDRAAPSVLDCWGDSPNAEFSQPELIRDLRRCLCETQEGAILFAKKSENSKEVGTIYTTLLSPEIQVLLRMDKIPHHLRNPGMNDSPVNANKQWLPMVSKCCERISSILFLGTQDLGPRTGSEATRETSLAAFARGEENLGSVFASRPQLETRAKPARLLRKFSHGSKLLFILPLVTPGERTPLQV